MEKSFVWVLQRVTAGCSIFEKIDSLPDVEVLSVFENEKEAVKALRNHIRCDLSNGWKYWLDEFTMETAGDDLRKLERVGLTYGYEDTLRIYKAKKVSFISAEEDEND